MTGGVVSTTVTVFVQSAKLLLQSVTCHQKSMVSRQVLEVFVTALTSMMVKLVQHALKAVGGMGAQTEPHCTV